MSELPPDKNAPELESPPTPGMTRIVISRARFDSVPRTRAWYIGLYTVSFLLWAFMAISMLRLEAPPIAAGEAPPSAEQTAEEAPAEPPELQPVEWPLSLRVARVLIPITLAIFYIPFVTVLRIMGYPWIGVLALCGFAFAPIPGLLVVAYLDTRIAKAWNAADLNAQDQQAPTQPA